MPKPMVLGKSVFLLWTDERKNGQLFRRNHCDLLTNREICSERMEIDMEQIGFRKFYHISGGVDSDNYENIRNLKEYTFSGCNQGNHAVYYVYYFCRAVCAQMGDPPFIMFFRRT